MTVVVHAPEGYRAERRYILGVVLGDWLGLDWRLTTHERPDLRIGLAEDPDGPAVTMPDALFSTPLERWLTDSALPSTPLPKRRVGAAAAGVLDAEEQLPVLYGGFPPASAALAEQYTHAGRAARRRRVRQCLRDARAPRYHLFDHPWVRDLMGRVHRRGHEIGLHAGFGTFLDAAATTEEFNRLRTVAEGQGVSQEVWGGRQRYLQWRNPNTWRNWCAAGLQYDCSVAFSEAVGFRTGTCREYTAFDLLARTPLDLVEKPFQVMNVSLFRHMALTAHDAAGAALHIARECRRYGGTLGILWHNDEVLRTAREKRWYEPLIATIAAL